MTFSVEQRFPFVSGDEDGRTLSYVAKGTSVDTDTDLAAENVVWASAPATWSGFTKRRISTVEEKSGLENLPIYYVDVEYGPLKDLRKDPAETGDVEFAFDVSLASVHVNYSLEVVNQYIAAGESVPPQTKAISVDNQGVPQGADITAPQTQFTLSYWPENAIITPAYRLAIENLVGAVCDSAFDHRAAGEVRLMGFRGRARNNDDWQLDFNFGVRKNVANQTIAGIPGITKDGWDLLDPVVRPEKQGSTVAPKLVGFRVQRIYERAPFTTLELPGITGGHT